MKSECLILTFEHHYGATQDYAKDAKNYFELIGYSTYVSTERDLNGLGRALQSKNLEIVFIIGTPPFNWKLNGNSYVWKYFLDRGVKVLSLLLDQIPYCLRIPGYLEYLRIRRFYENEVMYSFEGNISEILSDFCEKRVFFRQCYANSHKLSEQASADRKERWLFWGSIDTGLAKNGERDTLYQTVLDHNVWGLSELSIKRLCERLLYADDFFTYNTLSNFLMIDRAELFQEKFFGSLCVIDSKIKKDRRVDLIRRLLNYPVDVYGKGWDKYFPGSYEAKFLDPSPDLNATFALLCQCYSGLVNIDPNWGVGTNERVPTAAFYGLPILTNNNQSFESNIRLRKYSLEPGRLEEIADNFVGNLDLAMEPDEQGVSKQGLGSIPFFTEIGSRLDV